MTPSANLPVLSLAKRPPFSSACLRAGTESQACRAVADENATGIYWAGEKTGAVVKPLIAAFDGMRRDRVNHPYSTYRANLVQGRYTMDLNKDWDIDYDVVITVGHTDSVGAESLNQVLSVQRAEAVRSYWVAQGLDAARIPSQGEGEREPIASSTTQGRVQNRRVEIEMKIEMNPHAR